MSVKILLVDDNDVVRGLAREMLEEAGHDVIEADGAVSALRICRSIGGIDAVVTDLVMPDGDGLDLAASLALLCPGIRVLHTSAYADMRWTGNFIAKPYTSGELVRALDELVLQ